MVDNPLRSYLQPGYRDNLAGKIELTDEHDRPVELPGLELFDRPRAPLM